MPFGLIAGASIIGGGLGLAGSIFSSQAQTAAEQAALGLQSSEFSRAMGLLNPYAKTGASAFNTLASLYGINTPGNQPNWQAFLNTPAYQWAQQTGNNQLMNTLASEGQTLSGNQLTAAMNYNQGLASQQFTNVTNALQNMSNTGVTAASAVGNVASNAASTMGNTYGAIGQSQASGFVGGANALTGSIGSGVNNSLFLYGLQQKYGLGGAGGGMPNPSSYQSVNPGMFGTTGMPGASWGNTGPVNYLGQYPWGQ